MSELTDILSEYRKLGIEEQIDYERLYLYSVITHSTAVEGSTITEIENQLLFENGISPQKPIYEQLMNLDLKKAYEKALVYAREHRDFTVELLCQLSGIVMKNTGTEYRTLVGDFSSAAGDLRRLNVTAGRGGRSYLSYQKVPQRLDDFCKWLNTERKALRPDEIDKIYTLSFMAHYNLVYIHPWADGNGRMSRLVMNMVQTEYGVVPSIVKRESREMYIKALAESQDTGDASPFLQFMLRHHLLNLRDSISLFIESTNEDTLKL